MQKKGNTIISRVIITFYLIGIISLGVLEKKISVKLNPLVLLIILNSLENWYFHEYILDGGGRLSRYFKNDRKIYFTERFC